MDPLKAVVALTNRSENRVDLLRKTIDRIQQDCEHDFRLTEPVLLRTSQVMGVYLGGNLDRSAGRSSNQCFFLRCLKCSLVTERNVAHTCPRCLSPIAETKWSDPFDYHRPEKFFGGDHEEYYAIGAIRLTCAGCQLDLVAKLFDR